MPEVESPQRQAPDSLMLTGFWYRALPANRVHRNQLHKATLLEIPLVIGRDRANRPFALRDACPHRGMPLAAATSMEKMWNAPTMAGPSTRTTANAN